MAEFKVPNIPLNVVLGITATIVLIYLVNKVFGLFKRDETVKKEEEKSVQNTVFDPKYYTGKNNPDKPKQVKLLKQDMVKGIIVGFYYSMHDRMFNDPEEFAKWLYKITYDTQFSQVADAYAKRYSKDLKKDMETFNNKNYMTFINYINNLPSGFSK